MQNLAKKSSYKRLISLVLSVIMMINMLPVGAFAADCTLSTDKDVYLPGEPIYVNATSDISGSWVGLYDEGGSEGAYWLYYYVSESYGTNRNIYHSTGYTGYDPGKQLEAKSYDVVLYDAGYGELLRKTIKIEAPSSTDSALEAQETELTVGENVIVKGTSYNNGAWMAVYAGTKSEGDDLSGESYVSNWTYVNGVNNVWYNFGTLPVGTYSVVMFKDGGYIVDKSVTVTVAEAGVEIEPITTDKTEYTFGEPIMVTSMFGNPCWVGLYKQSDANPTSEGPTSMFWLYANPGEPVNILSGEQQRHNEYIAGTYKVLLLDANYGLVGSVENITITAEETDTVTTPPYCEADGKIVISYNDGTTKTITAEEDDSLKALGHDYDVDNDGNNDWLYNAENKTHTMTCQNPASTCEKHEVTGDCSFDEGVVVGEDLVFTCSVCEGTYSISAKEVVKREVGEKATCQKEGYYNVEYADGTKGTEPIAKLDHEWSDWTHVDGTATHERVCKLNGTEEGHKETEKCKYTKAPVTDSSANKLTYTCDVCKGEKAEAIITIEKSKYNYGEAINVVVNDDYSGRAEKDWIGLYLENDVPGTADEQSFYWNYLYNLSLDGFNMIDSSNSALADIKGSLYPYRADEYIGGKYKIYLFSNDGFGVIAETEVFDIVAVKTDEKITEATCEADGETVIYYNDGTKDVTKHDKLGHDYDIDNDGNDDWAYDKTNKTHTKTCQNEATLCNATVRSITENCSFGEGVITTPAIGTEAGIKTFTCSLCGGTYTEEYFDKVVTGTEVIKKATCQEEGILRTYYSDNTHSDSSINKLSCDFGDWVHVEGTETHERVCMLDGTATGHKETDDCSYNLTSRADGKLTYTCDICVGSYSKVILSTNKTEYNFGEPIMVSYDYTSDGDTWIGLYGKDDDIGTSLSFYWNYLSALSSPFNMISGENAANLLPERWADYVAGDYKIVLFQNGGYDVATSVDITIVATEDYREKTDPTCDEDGKIVIYYSDGTTETITVEQDVTLKAKGHAYPVNWTFDKNTKTHSKVCANDADHVESGKCSFDAGVVTKEPSYTEAGEKTFTCSVCGGSYTEAFTDKVLIRSEVVKEPTCKEKGILGSWYEGDVYIETDIDVLEHVWSDWSHVEGTATHERICMLDGTTTGHKESASCDRSSPVATLSENKVDYTCSICNGNYSKPILSLDKEVYTTNDYVNVTLNSDWQGSDAWVGLYKDNEDAGTALSIFWYYQSEEAETVDILGTRDENGRSMEYGVGDFKVVLFNHDSYDAEVTLYFEVVEPSEDDPVEQTNYSVSINGQLCENGDHLKFESDDSISLVIDADGKVSRNAWVGVYYGKMDENTEFSEDAGSQYWEWIKDIEGQRLNIKQKLNDLSLTYGDFSIVVFGGTGKTDYDDVRSIVTFTIEMDESNSTVIKKPTCTNYGTAYVGYDDGTFAYVPIRPLGHDVKEWTFNEASQTHSGLCLREECGLNVTMKCKFDDGVIVGKSEDGSSVAKLFTCSICGGSYIDNEDIIKPIETIVNRVAGATRAETSLLIADTLKAKLGVEKFSTIIIADGTEFADALTGSYLAAKKDAPILMFTGKNLADLQLYVKNNLASDGIVYILGGVNAIPQNVEDGFEGLSVKRLAGKDRYATNLEILKEAGVTNEEIIVATAYNFADSLSASSVGKPILLVNSRTGKLTTDQKAYLASISTEKFFILGGTTAVSANLEEEIRQFGSTERLGGATRYETSIIIANRFYSKPSSIVIADAITFPDGLCGGPLANAMSAPLVLTAISKEANAKDYVAGNNIKTAFVLGGQLRIDDATARNIFNLDESVQIVEIK